MENDERSAYWDDSYFVYWKKRVEESQSEMTGRSTVVPKDHVVPGDVIYSRILDGAKVTNGTILDVGCAWGRLFYMFGARGLNIYGVDISSKMVAEAKKITMKEVIEIRESLAESLPYSDNMFDFVVCFGVFDATYQNQSLGEFCRVVKHGGKVILTGKSINYRSDDEEASLAENGARRKGEPNYFTDVRDMLYQLEKKGHIIDKQFYFEKRGDFSKGICIEIMPQQYYEYCIVIRKNSENYEFKPFYYQSSKIIEEKRGPHDV